MGIPPLFGLWTALPLLREANYLHAAQILQACLAVLAGMGVSALRERAAVSRIVPWALVGAIGLLIGSSWVPISRFLASEGQFYFLGRAFDFPVHPLWTLLTLFLVLVLFRMRHRVLSLSALIVANGFVFGFFFNTSSDLGLLQARPAVVEQLAQHPHSRLVGIGAGTLLPNFGMSWGIRDFRGYEPLLTDRWEHFYAALGPALRDYHHPIPELDVQRLALLRKAGCEFVLTARELDLPDLEPIRNRFPYLYRIRGASRLEIADTVVPAGDGDSALALMLSGEQGVVLEGVADRPLSAGSGTVRWIGDLPDLVEIEVQMESPGWLVLRDTYAKGWQAQVGRDEAEIVRADYLFRAVRVPAGRHLVRFRYQPGSFSWGAVLSVLSLGIVASMFWRKRY